MSDSRHEWFFEETENLINTLNQVELLIIQLRSRMHGVGLYETESDYEDRISLQEKKRHDIWLQKSIDGLEDIRNSPYFGRVDLFSAQPLDLAHRSKYYIGKKGVVDRNDSTLVYDWRAPISEVFYDKAQKEVTISSHKYNLALRRSILIKKAELVSVFNEFDAKDSFMEQSITDPFLLRTLREKREQPRITDIIVTIQAKQNKIIRLPIEESIIIQGCAGSGKTMVLFHRLSFIKYNNPNFDFKRIKIITPSLLFNNVMGELSRDLDVDSIPMIKIEDYYNYLASKYSLSRQLYIRDPENLELQTEIYSSSYLISCLSILNEFYKHLIRKYCDPVEISARISKYFSFNIQNLITPPWLSCLEEIYGRLDPVFRNQEKLFEKLDKLQKKIEKCEETLVNEEKEHKEIHNENRTLFETIDLKHTIIKRLENEKEKTLLSVRDLSSKITEVMYDNYISRENSLKRELNSERAKINSSSTFSFFRNMNTNNHIQLLESKIRILEQDYEEKQKRISDLLKRISNNSSELDVRILEVLNKESSSNSKLFSLTSELNALGVRYNMTQKSLDMALSELSELLSKLTNDQRSIINRFEEVGTDIIKQEEDIAAAETEIRELKTNAWDKQDYDYIKTCVTYLSNMIRNGEQENVSNYETIDEFKLDEIIYDHLVDVAVIPIFEKHGSQFNKKSRFSLVIKLLISFCSRGTVILPDQLICIDECQELSEGEIWLLRQINGEKTAFNLFGDIQQRTAKKGQYSWAQCRELLGCEILNLNENYRNSLEITNYCNSVFDLSMVPIGIECGDVEVLNEKEGVAKITETVKRVISKRIAIILASSNVELYQKITSLMNIVAHRIIEGEISILFTVESKGLEFDTVFVFPEEMSVNEQYIAFTRALTKLYVIHSS